MTLYCRVEPDFRVTRVWAKNFRSIGDASMELDPLTILVGPNASGKSNLLDVLRFIKDALFSLREAVSQRQGMEQVVRRGARSEDSDVEVGVAAVVRDPNAESDYYIAEYGFTLTPMAYGRYKVSREYVKVREEDDSEAIEFRIEDGKLTASDFFMEGPRRLPCRHDTDRLAFQQMIRILRRLLRNADEGRAASLCGGMLEFHRKLTSMRFYDVSPDTIRKPRRSSYALTLQEDAENIGTVIKELGRANSGSMARLKKDVGRLMPGVSDMDVIEVGGSIVVRLKRDSISGGSWLDLSMESDGTIRLLGLAVALYQQPYLPVIGIEKPDLTVNPNVLAVLADMINEASRRSQVIITTHSPDLIDYLTDYRKTDCLRIVELTSGVTTVRQIPHKKAVLVKKHLASPGELFRTGELTVRRPSSFP